MYEKLNNKELLIDLYQNQKKSLPEIAKIFGCKSTNSVRQRLVKYGIPTRSVSEGLTKNKNKFFIDNKSVIDGCLMGDGFMRKYNNTSNSSHACFLKKNKYKEHIFYVARQIYKDYRSIIKEVSAGKQYDFNYWFFRTPAIKEFDIYFSRWYPSPNFKKIIPKDIKIDKPFLLNWFMDDGSTIWRKRKYKKTSNLRMSSQCFSLEDHEFLVSKIADDTGLDFRIYKTNSGTGYLCGIRQSKVNDFFDYIGECPIECMNYKWKIGD